MEKLIEYVEKLPLTSLTIGIIVPLVSAFLSYFLVERSAQKKDANRLYIQIELLRRELECNKIVIEDFLELNKKYQHKKSKILVENVILKKELYEVLLRLENIKKDYFAFDQYVFERPSILLKLSSEIEKLEENLTDLKQEMVVLSQSENPIISREKALQILNIEEQIKEKKKEIYINIERDVYKEFMLIQQYIDSNLIEGWYEKIDDSGKVNLKIFKYIYDNINEFNNLQDKTKENVVQLYKTLLMYEIRLDDTIINDNRFDEEMFQFFYGERYKEHPMIEIYKDFYHQEFLHKIISNYKFNILNQRWDILKDGLVLLNDRELYIDIDDFYDSIDFLKNLQSIDMNETNLKRLNEECSNLLHNVKGIQNNLIKKEKSVKKLC
ncbi:hypothetical protein [Alkaliphilus peptidifermentans]|uniref:Uncharacterized protein n=1 Tax=Alkaliphilus peptidifermentans DSM 18978 TaxID=1120976 RepID=A0A1G5EF25_9FIRM|nr:hypothetical protein [Alkaliphilus peptidifermentans]SCY25613.1 hypothetical protein SAMN03080606_01140 [Alkaliphilus peptidifermentans DSM 18978]